VTAAGPSNGARPPMIMMHDVEKHFGTLHVLKNIQLDVPAGQVVIVIGPSGSGKSTLCRTINRLESIDSGEIAIDGVPLPAEGKGLAQLRADVGMVFQSFNLFAHKTILQNVTLGPIKVRKMRKKDADELADSLLKRVGIAEQRDKLPAQLSGGQQQRVMVSLAREGMTMVVVTHEMGFARKAGDRVLFMADGEIVEDGTPQEFFTNPTSNRAKDFLSKILTH